MDHVPTSPAPAAALTAADIVKEVKWNGYFDQFRKDCLADKSSQPLFTNLERLVEDLVQKYLTEQTWNSQLKRSDIRDKVIKRLNDNYHITNAVNSITDSVVSSKIELSFRPIIDKIVENWESGAGSSSATATAAQSSSATTSTTASASETASAGAAKTTSAKPASSSSQHSVGSVKVEDFLVAKENKPQSSAVQTPKSEKPDVAKSLDKDKMVKKPIPGVKEAPKPGASTPSGANKPPVKTTTTTTVTTPSKTGSSAKPDPSKAVSKTSSTPATNAPSSKTPVDPKKTVKTPTKAPSTPASGSAKTPAAKPAVVGSSKSAAPSTAKPSSSSGSTSTTKPPVFEFESSLSLEPDPTKEYNFNWRLDWKPSEADEISVSSVSDSDLTDYEIIREVEAEEAAKVKKESSDTSQPPPEPTETTTTTTTAAEKVKAEPETEPDAQEAPSGDQ